MKCPNDDMTLQMTTREGIEIDYCPQCRGVWLDRGELDKIIERSASSSPAPHYDHGRNEHRDDDDYRHHDQKKHKKEGFLGDLFDF